MTHQELEQIVAALVTQLSTQGFETPSPLRRSSAPAARPAARRRRPRSRAAYGVIEPSGVASVHLCT
jgi:hypothetical protein